MLVTLIVSYEIENGPDHANTETPKAFTNSSLGLFQPQVEQVQIERYAESVREFRAIKLRTLSAYGVIEIYPGVEATPGWNWRTPSAFSLPSPALISQVLMPMKRDCSRTPKTNDCF